MVEFKIGDEVELIKETISKLTDRDWSWIGKVDFDKIIYCDKLIITNISTGIEINRTYFYPKKCFRLKNKETVYELW